MPPFDFPNFPTDGMVITGPGGTRYQWTAADGKWRVPQPSQFVTQQQLDEALQGKEIYNGPSPPPGPNHTGDLWFDTTNNVLNMWDGSAWVPATDVSGFLPLNGGTMTGSIVMADPFSRLIMPVMGVINWNVVGANTYRSDGAAAAIQLSNTGVLRFYVYPTGIANTVIPQPTAFLELQAGLVLKDSAEATVFSVNPTGVLSITKNGTGQLVVYNVGGNASWVGGPATTGASHQLTGATAVVDQPVLRVLAVNAMTTDFFQVMNASAVRLGGVQSDGPVFGYGPYNNIASFRRHKADIKPIEDATARIKRLRPRAYHHIPRDTQEHGFVIEDLLEDYPEAVMRNKDGEPDGYAATVLLPAVVAALQDALARIEALEGAR